MRAVVGRVALTAALIWGCAAVDMIPETLEALRDLQALQQRAGQAPAAAAASGKQQSPAPGGELRCAATTAAPPYISTQPPPPFLRGR